MKRPAKCSHVLEKVRECLELGLYYDTSHAVKRKEERRVGLQDVLYVLRTGFHEKKKDEYKPEFCDWNYAIRGKTVDGKEVRVAVAFDEDGMLIITVIDLTRGSV